MSITEYHAKYFAYELSRRFSSDSIEKLVYTLSDAKVDLNPHQVEAAYFAFKSPLSNGALLADEVGLGKTIEAGIIISQKWAERKRKLLLIVPANLRKQWNQELQEKFFLPSIILDTKNFKDLSDKISNPFLQENKIIIVSYEFSKKMHNQIKSIDWDLVVLDEAHRLRNVYQSTKIESNIIKSSIENRPKLLLTATPFQNNLDELYGLISIIDEYHFGDLISFRKKYKKKSLTNLELEDLKKRLETACFRTLRKNVLEYIKYTKRRPIHHFFTPSEDELELYNKVMDFVDTFYGSYDYKYFIDLIYQKILASSSFAIKGTIEKILSKLRRAKELYQNEKRTLEEEPQKQIDFDELILESDIDEFKFLSKKNEYDVVANEINFKADNIDQIISDNLDYLKVYLNTCLTTNPNKSYLEIIDQLEKNLGIILDIEKKIKINSKGQSLLEALREGFKSLENLGAEKKAIIFTESLRTQEYLKGILKAEGYKTILFNGSNDDKESENIYKEWLIKYKNTDKVTGSKNVDIRAALVEYFKNTSEIMIATEAAAEGLNLQFCSMVVNYDLPWNPQRVEQRIGRCHRYGQKFDVVVINLITEGNFASHRIYTLLNEKFKLFENILGASDDVLGIDEYGFEFEEKIGYIFKTCRTNEQIELAFNKLQKELEEKIELRKNSAYKTLLNNFDDEVRSKLNINKLTNKEGYLNIFEDIIWKLTKHFLSENAIFDDENYSFELLKNPFIEEKINVGIYKFKSNSNEEYPNIYRIGHTLAQKIIENTKNIVLPVKELVFNSNEFRTRIAGIDELIGKKGWMNLSMFTVSAFEKEDHFIFSGVIENESIKVDSEQLQKFFFLPASINQNELLIPEKIKEDLKKNFELLKNSILEENKNKNIKLINFEEEKLDKWMDDKRYSINLEINQIKTKIKDEKKNSKNFQASDKIESLGKIKKFQNQINELYRKMENLENEKSEKFIEIVNKSIQEYQEIGIFTIKFKVI